MTQTFFWYDLETTGINPREARVMQFAGQRTDMDLQPVGEPVNVLIRLSEDVLPDPDAILVTGITPQQTVQDGITEAEFMQLFTAEVATPGTIFAGFNTVRFDDEFMRCLHYRNFYDPYQWQWKDGRSRWDLLDVVRMTRALRPDGINWPMVDGKPTNRLELLTAENGLSHEQAHDALSDVTATIAVAQLIKTKQPKLFDWLLQVRDKKKVAEVVEGANPFVYSSGKYPNEFEKTAVVVRLAPHPKRDKALVFDLRHDPSEYFALTTEQLVERWRWTGDKDAAERLPVKTLQYNRCPAVAPLGVLDAASQKRLSVDLASITKHRNMLLANPDFAERVLAALAVLDTEQDARYSGPQPVDARIYDRFLDDTDAGLSARVRAADPSELGDIAEKYHDERMAELLPLYKARNFASKLTDEERAAWEQHRFDTLLAGGTNSKLAQYGVRLAALADTKAGKEKSYLLEELQLYAESIVPIVDNE